MTPKQKATVVSCLEQAADIARDAMLHAQTALIDLEYNDPSAARERAKLVCSACSKAQGVASEAFVIIGYTSPGESN